MKDEFLSDRASDAPPHFLKGHDDRAMVISKSAQKALSWGSAEIVIVVLKRGGAEEVHALAPAESVDFMRGLDFDPSVDGYTFQVGTVESTGAASWEE